MARRNDLIDKSWPVVWPFLLQNRNKDEVELVQESSLTSKLLFRIGILDDEVNDEVPNT